MIRRLREIRGLGFDGVWLGAQAPGAFERALELLPRIKELPYARKKTDACTRPGMTAEEVVRSTLALTSSGDADAINDCFALELIEQNAAGFSGWARMGPVRDVQIRSLGTRGGRYDIGATWIFERDPGGAWGFPQAGQFFTVGLEGERLRIFELATGIGKFPR